jgi:acetyl esterase/lipase
MSNTLSVSRDFADIDPQYTAIRAIADRLTEADAPNRLSIHPGALHSFLQLAGHLDPADRTIAEIATGLREILLASRWPQQQIKRQCQRARR